MRKFTRLLAVFATTAFVATTATAQQESPTFTPVEGLNNLTTGWYQIKVGDGNGSSNYHAQAKGRYVCVDPIEAGAKANNGDNSMFLLNKEELTNECLSLFYVTVSGSSCTIKAFNGNYMATTGYVSSTAVNIAVSVPSTTAPTQFKLGSTIMAWSWTTGKYGLGMSSSSSVADARFQFSKVKDADLEAWRAEAKKLALAATPGNPNEQARTKLLSDIVSATDISGLSTVYAAYVASERACPESGKAYTLTVYFPKAGTKGVLYIDGDGSLKCSVTETAEQLGNKAKFISGYDETNSTYYLVSAVSNYFAYPCNGATHTVGHTANYNARDCGITYEAADSEYPKILGTLRLKMKRSDNSTGLVIFSEDGSKSGWNESSNYYSTASNVIKMEEVGFPYNMPELRTAAVQEEGDDKAYASLYLPFNTSIPKGVEAYAGTVVSRADNGKELQLTKVEGTLPARTAVILTCAANSEEKSFTFLPTTDAGTAVSATALSGTVDTEAAVEDNTYILNGGSSVTDEHGIGFYPYEGSYLPEYKAVLVNPTVEGASLSVSKLSLNFGKPTGISSVVAEEDGKQVVYDLGGRRVLQPTSGLYIVNGKKVLIKK